MKTIIVEELSKPIRLDKYLKKEIDNISREKIIHNIKEGKVKIEGKTKIKPSFILSGGERILFNDSDFIISIEKLSLIKPQSIFPEPKILYEDKNLLVINKPSGIIVHPTLNGKNNLSIASWFLKRNPSVCNVGEDRLRPGIVHRLDKETSGVLILAKNNFIFDYLKNLFKTRKIEKEYIGLVKGEMRKQDGIIRMSFVNFPNCNG